MTATKQQKRPQIMPRVAPKTKRYLVGVSNSSRLTQGEVLDRAVDFIHEKGEDEFYDDFLMRRDLDE